MEVDDQGRVRGGCLDRGDVFAHRERRVAADGVGRRRPRPTGFEAFPVDLRDVIDVGPAAVLASELDRGRALLARVPDRLAHHAEVCLPVIGNGKLQPLRVRDAVAMQQRLAELVLDVEV